MKVIDLRSPFGFDALLMADRSEDMKVISQRLTRRRFLQAAASTGVLGAWVQHPALGDQLTPSRLAGLDDYVEKAMARWDVPGLAIAVVQEGKVVHARGYGVRSVGEDAKVDAETVFAIASCTKPFIAAAIAKLIDNGRLQWDDPISKHLSAFQLFDPELTARVTIRQALRHRTGLPTANMLWRSGAFDGNEVLARLRWLQPVAAPGEKFIYNNNMYLVLGRIVEKVSGRKWDDFLRNELFQPLGMKSTSAAKSEIRRWENVAAPHATDAGKLQRIQRYIPDATAPAGAIHSNVLDMAQWLKLHLEGGVSDDRQVISKVRMEEMHTAPQQAEKKDPAEPRDPRVSTENYGLGWFFNDQGGRQVVEHSGNGNGFVSWVAMIPEERLGLVVLSNHHNTGLNLALRIWILDALLGRTQRDWSERVRSGFAKVLGRFREAKANYAANRPMETALSRPLPEFAGRYTSPLYGDVVITEKDGRLNLQFGTRFKGDMQHWEKDSFRAFFPNPRLDDWLVTFAIKEGQVTGLHVKEAPWAPPDYNDADDLGEFHRG
jgi:CubicO group peptidase (beta-lactamase class C family)